MPWCREKACGATGAKRSKFTSETETPGDFTSLAASLLQESTPAIEFDFPANGLPFTWDMPRQRNVSRNIGAIRRGIKRGIRRLTRSYRQFIVDVTVCVDIQRFQVSVFLPKADQDLSSRFPDTRNLTGRFLARGSALMKHQKSDAIPRGISPQRPLKTRRLF